MRKTRIVLTMRSMIVISLTAMLLAACGKPGYLPYSATENPDKGILYQDSQGRERLRKIEVACYVDVSKYNPLNAGDYILKDSGTRFFDYVIVGDAYIKRASGGPYLELSEDTRRLFARRHAVLGPLQKSGIRVLLGITGGGEKISFGSLDTDEMLAFADTVYQTLEMYSLDGVEFYDGNVEPAAYPREADYNSVNAEGLAKEEWLLEQWKKGGNSMNNLNFALRLRFDTVPNNRVIFLRESNYGCYLPQMVVYSKNGSDFASAGSQITYTISNRFDKFIPDSLLRLKYTVNDTEDDTAAASPRIIQSYQYGPLAIDLDGGAAKNAFYPYMQIPADTFRPGADNDKRGHEFIRSITEFKNGNYRVVYYHNLKAVSEAKDDAYYKWLYYDSGKPESPEFANDKGVIASNPKYIPLQYLFNKLSQELFGENLVELQGKAGDHIKDW